MPSIPRILPGVLYRPAATPPPGTPGLVVLRTMIVGSASNFIVRDDFGGATLLDQPFDTAFSIPIPVDPAITMMEMILSGPGGGGAAGQTNGSPTTNRRGGGGGGSGAVAAIQLVLTPAMKAGVNLTGLLGKAIDQYNAGGNDTTVDALDILPALVLTCGSNGDNGNEGGFGGPGGVALAAPAPWVGQNGNDGGNGGNDGQQGSNGQSLPGSVPRPGGGGGGGGRNDDGGAGADGDSFNGLSGYAHIRVGSNINERKRGGVSGGGSSFMPTAAFCPVPGYMNYGGGGGGGGDAGQRGAAGLSGGGGGGCGAGRSGFLPGGGGYVAVAFY